MFCKKVRRDSLLRRLGRECLGAILAEFEATPMTIGVGPSATGAIESIELVDSPHRTPGSAQTSLAQSDGERLGNPSYSGSDLFGLSDL
jgi:hypothetical protein